MPGVIPCVGEVVYPAYVVAQIAARAGRGLPGRTRAEIDDPYKAVFPVPTICSGKIVLGWVIRNQIPPGKRQTVIGTIIEDAILKRCGADGGIIVLLRHGGATGRLPA